MDKNVLWETEKKEKRFPGSEKIANRSPVYIEMKYYEKSGFPGTF